jgi:hypothetical protein
MKRIMIVGLCLTSAFLMSAVAAATASASAETPQFRWTGAKEFSSKGGIGKLETSKGEEVECKEETDRGEIEGSSPSTRARDILISYKKCTSPSNLGGACKSAGANAGEIKTFDLLARIGWINKAKKEVGILFNPEIGISGNPNNLFAEFTCEPGLATIAIKVRGSVIVPITPAGKPVGPSETTKFFSATFEKAAGKGKQKVTKFEGESANKLETETTISGGFIESAAEGVAEIFPLVSTEIEV